MSAPDRRGQWRVEIALPPNALLLFGLAAAILLAIGAVLAPRAVAWGWLIGFLVWTSAPVGAVVLALIHETTGGRWGLASAPVLRLGALCAVFLPFFFAFLLAGLKSLYPWVNGGASTAPDIARFYFNVPVFAAVGFAAAIGWGAIGAMLAAGWLGLIGASVALVFHGFAVSLASVQWLLSIDPSFSNSAFGAEIAVQQIMLALAAIAVLQPAHAAEIADGDIGGLLFATCLGAFYLGLMTFIVKWYGDQPVDAAWYLGRERGLQTGLLVGAVILGAVIPIVGCAWERARASVPAMRCLGLSAIVGVFLHDPWFAGPASPGLAIPAALLAIAAMSCLSVGLSPFLDRRLAARAQDVSLQGGQR